MCVCVWSHIYVCVVVCGGVCVAGDAVGLLEADRKLAAASSLSSSGASWARAWRGLKFVGPGPKQQKIQIQIQIQTRVWLVFSIFITLSAWYAHKFKAVHIVYLNATRCQKTESQLSSCHSSSARLCRQPPLALRSTRNVLSCALFIALKEYI